MRALRMRTKHFTKQQKRILEGEPWTGGDLDQGQKRNPSPWQHTTNASIASKDNSSNSSQLSTSTSSRTQNRKDETQNKAATVWSNKSNIHTTSKVSTTNSWLLDQRRTLVEEGTCQTTTWPLHSTANRRWARRHKAHNRTNNNGEANQWSTMVQNRWRLDNKAKNNTRPGVDRINQLRGDSSLQGRVHHRWCRGARRSEKGKKGFLILQQPTAQERLGHELTHLPYRSWCPVYAYKQIVGQTTTQSNNKTPVIQCDLTYYKAIGEQATSPIFTAIDVETGMCIAAQIEDKTQSMQYLSTSLQQFLMECGRTHAVLNNTVIQSDNEDFLVALLKATATAMGSNIALRQSPAYTLQAQGSVEHFHRTLVGQVRALKLQLENSYNTRLTSKHPIMPWMVKHAAYLLNRYATHTDGNTSCYRCWNKEHKTPFCDFGETVLYLLPTVKHIPKMEARFFPAIWLGKDTSTNENTLGISNKVIRRRTIRRRTTNNSWMSSTTRRWQLQQHQASSRYQQHRWWQDLRQQQSHKHLHNRRNQLPQRQHSHQHAEDNSQPLQTCQWQQHPQHKGQEHHCQGQHHQSAMWQMT